MLVEIGAAELEVTARSEVVEGLSDETGPVADGHDQLAAVDEVEVVAWVEPVFFYVVDLVGG